jgi:hypothetical protein
MKQVKCHATGKNGEVKRRKKKNLTDIYPKSKNAMWLSKAKPK